MEKMNVTNITNSNGTTPQYVTTYACFVYTIAISGVLQGGLYITALLGNAMCFFTWTKIGRSKGFNSSVVLMQSLALSDLLSQVLLMVLIIVPSMLRITDNFSHPFLLRYSAYCNKYGWPLASTGNCVTVWLTSLITLHRFSVLNKPFSSVTRRLTSVPSTVAQVCCITVLAATYQIPRLFSLTIIQIAGPNGELVHLDVPSELNLKQSYQLYYHSVSYIVLVNVLPLTICTVLTIKILLLLSRAKSRRQHMTAAGQAHSGKEAAVTKMLLTVVVIFIICQLPNTVNRTYGAFRPAQRVVCESFLFFAYPLTIICVAINSSINVFVYARYSQEFRAVLSKSLCCCCLNISPPNNASAINIDADDENPSTQALSSSKLSVSVVETVRTVGTTVGAVGNVSVVETTQL